ncbi:MAG TPA: cation:proton antiporter [Vicinamibacterales bacterium]|nr:cation:proton antiporter [Vicinamibacterales bacterium]
MSPISAGTFLIVASATAVAWAGGRLARRFGQPPVVGELAAGMLLGPSVFGLIAPELSRQLFTPDVTGVIAWISSSAILVFMFLAGLEIDVGLLRRHAHGVARIAGVSLVLPFALGSALAVWLYPSLGGPAATPLTFTLFLGIAMSITAMPVLTRILVDLQMLRSTAGTIAMGCATIDDVAAWTLLGIVVGLVRGETIVVPMMLMTAGYLAAMFFVVRPLLQTLAGLRRRPGGRFWWALIVVLLAALSSRATEYIGLHAVFGVFLLGVCVPRHTDVLAGFERPIQRISAMLLPAFFVIIGLRTDVGSFGSTSGLALAAILACAVAGKLGGSALASRSLGLGWRDALVIGALLNTRGLVELVALDIGRSLGILSPALFTMLVVMTFVTTFATAPLVRWLDRRPPLDTARA